MIIISKAIYQFGSALLGVLSVLTLLALIFIGIHRLWFGQQATNRWVGQLHTIQPISF